MANETTSHTELATLSLFSILPAQHCQVGHDRTVCRVLNLSKSSYTSCSGAAANSFARMPSMPAMPINAADVLQSISWTAVMLTNTSLAPSQQQSLLGQLSTSFDETP